MTLVPSTRLGPYEILAPLGAGGMGEVYRARDTRLDRAVAIKILPENISARPQARERFEREARAVSSLNHPHICTLYDVGHQDGIDYLVMEYLEGETLAHRLKKGLLPPDQVLRYAIQMTEALDTAHKHGVIHRDLKPGNIMLTKSGAKLLDFGLAKVRAGEAAAGVTALPTQTAPLTGEGTILGTLQYMAPEQLEGKESDARTDIFALGAVIYEMATGQKAFKGKSHASLIAAILEREPPPISTMQSMAPTALDHVVRTCLAKEPNDRWQSAHDLFLELQWMIQTGEVQSKAAAPFRHRSLRWAAMALVTLLIGSLGFAIGYYRRSNTETPTVRFQVYPPEKTSVAGLSLAVSPDGRRLAFVAIGENGKQALWVRTLDSLFARLMPGTEGAALPFWSPDSRFVGFFAGGKLRKIEVEVPGGSAPVQTLCNAPVSGGAWNRDNVILCGMSDGIYRISASGGEATRVTMLDPARKEQYHVMLWYLPDGRHFLFSIRADQRRDTGTFVGSLDARPDTRDRRRLLPEERVIYSPPGYLIFRREESLLAQPFDARHLQLTGVPIAVGEQTGWLSTGDFSASKNGVLAWQRTEGPSSRSELVWFDRTGKRLGTVGSEGRYRQPWLAPDGKTVAVEILDQAGQTADIWQLEMERNTASRFTFDPAWDYCPIWSPDGSRIVFGSNRKSYAYPNLYIKPASGARPEELLVESEEMKFPTDWSRDGRFIVYQSHSPSTGWDLWVLPMDGERKPFPFLRTEFTELEGRFSPDGHWLAYSSNETGRWEIYVQSFPEPGRKSQVSTRGGRQPKWRRDGRELFYIAADGKFMSVEVKAHEAFSVGVPRAMFDAALVDPNYLNYDVTADGRRFLMNTRIQDPGSAFFTVVLNWTAGLKR
jgi:serine/threonine protein kinase/Tol biopolymer transport system component